MKCKKHGGAEAFNTCCGCGEWICDDCAVDINGRNFCKECLSKKMGAESYPVIPPVKPAASGYGSSEHHKKRINGASLFVCSMVPGCGHMYLGLIKRGFFIMTSFFAAVNFTSGGAWILIPVIWFTSFFDSFNLKNRILKGESELTDMNDDIPSLFSEYKLYIIAAVAVMIFSEISKIFRFGHIPFGSIVSVGLVIVLIYSFLKQKKKDGNDNDDHDRND